MGLFGGKSNDLPNDVMIKLIATATHAVVRSCVRERKRPDRQAVGRMLMAAEMETGIKTPWSSRARAVEAVSMAGELIAPDIKAMREIEDLLSERPDILRNELTKAATKAATKKHLIRPEKV